MTLTYANDNDHATHAAQISPAESSANVKARRANESRLRRIGRRTFVFASIGHVVIGLLHTSVQLTDLAAPTIRGELEAIGDVANVEGASAWELWQGLGLLFGFFMIALGLSNLAGMKGRIDDYPAAGVCAVNMLIFVGIFAIGALYLGPTQLFGGPFGFAMFGLTLLGSRQR